VITLYDYPASPNCRKVRIALEEKGLFYEKRLVDISKGEHRAESFLRLNPHGRIPALLDQDAQGQEVIVYDSTIINEYLEDAYPAPPLLPQAPAARAMARALEDWADNLLSEPVGELYAQFVFTAESRRNQGRIEEARMRIVQLLERAERILGDGRDYLVGDYSLADAALTPHLAYATQFGAPIKEGLPRVQAWFLRLKNRPSFEAT
jgi:glutathione S-transferase